MPNILTTYRYDYFSDYLHTPDLSLKDEIKKRVRNKLRNVGVVRKLNNVFKRYKY